MRHFKNLDLFIILWLLSSDALTVPFTCVSLLMSLSVHFPLKWKLLVWLHMSLALLGWLHLSLVGSSALPASFAAMVMVPPIPAASRYIPSLIPLMLSPGSLPFGPGSVARPNA